MHLSAHLAILTYDADGHQITVLLTRRGPQYALPSAPCGDAESAEATATRLLAHLTGAAAAARPLEQLPVRTDPGRSTPGRWISVPYVVCIPGPAPAAPHDPDPARYAWVGLDAARSAPFADDHHQILADAHDRLLRLLTHTNAVTDLVAAPFTITDLRAVYETAWGARIDPGNFHRKVVRQAKLCPTGATTMRDGGRPATLYRSGPRCDLPQPFRRSDNRGPAEATGARPQLDP